MTSARRIVAGIAVAALALRAWVAFATGATWVNSDSVDYFNHFAGPAYAFGVNAIMYALTH